MENTNINNEAVAMVPVENTQAVNVFADDGFDITMDLTSRKTQLCSMVAETDEQKVSLYNAMNNPDKRLADCINMTIRAKDLFVEVVPCTNQETGETNLCPRIVIIDDKGVSYQCVSIGIYSALKKLIQVYGVPTWKKPVLLTVKQISKGTRKMLTLENVKA